ncbi:uncharacterized protein LOC131666602 [Phymastichus coffea]|uniref:uncharacterized protein LOC131666602 n=1 Tax=Phymastichus coffea TaxID=108790 RepID=UPI00273BCFE6|nr:uncharacterized protein LOC131666602 [Phymastichus coffea]
MKIYVFIFILSCYMFEHSCSSSSNWKEIILIRQQIREIKSIIDNALMPLKIMIYKKRTLEAIGCYKEAKSKLSGVRQIGYSGVTMCIKNSTKDVAAGITCAVNVQQTVRETSRGVSIEAVQCISDPTRVIDDPKTHVSTAILKEIDVE